MVAQRPRWLWKGSCTFGGSELGEDRSRVFLFPLGVLTKESHRRPTDNQAAWRIYLRGGGGGEFRAHPAVANQLQNLSPSIPLAPRLCAPASPPVCCLLFRFPSLLTWDPLSHCRPWPVTPPAFGCRFCALFAALPPLRYRGCCEVVSGSAHSSRHRLRPARSSPPCSAYRGGRAPCLRCS